MMSGYISKVLKSNQLFLRHSSNNLLINNRFNSIRSLSISINWKKKCGTIVKTEAKVGETLLNVAHTNGIELEGVSYYYLL